MRAVCDLPFGSTEVIAPSAMINLLGEVWLQSEAPHITPTLAVPAIRLHLYGKTSAREGRKMGHLTATGANPEEALQRVLIGYERLSPATAHALELHRAVPMLRAHSA